MSNHHGCGGVIRSGVGFGFERHADEVGNRDVKKVTAMLLVYAIIVIASSVFWACYFVSKSRTTAGSSGTNISAAADVANGKQNSQMVMKATELTGGVTDDVKADGQANDNVMSNDL